MSKQVQLEIQSTTKAQQQGDFKKIWSQVNRGQAVPIWSGRMKN